MPHQVLDPDVIHTVNTVLFALFGSLLGSFCNVVILRMAAGRSVIFPPSSCPHCQHPLSALDLIPVFGWVLLLGRCRYCSAPISWQYPLVESFTSFALAFSYWTCGASPRFIPTAAWAIIWMIVAVSHFREEVTRPGPFLWPVGAYAVLALAAGGAPWQGLGEALPIGLVCGFLGSRGGRSADFYPWMGSGITAVLGRAGLGWPAVGGIALAAAVIPELGQARLRMMGKVAVLAIQLGGICAWIGSGFSR